MLKTLNRDNYWMLNWLDDYMIGHNGFICGGCFKNIFNHEKVKDLDIFFESEEDFYDAVNYFDSMTEGYDSSIGGLKPKDVKYKFYYENDNVKAYKNIDTGIVVELCCKIFGTPKEILDKFDFTIVKFAYYKDGVEDEVGSHIEYKILCDENFFEHLHIKRLVIDNNCPYPMSTFERIIKYGKYGYYPCKETKLKLIKHIRELPESAIELSNSLYDGID